MSADEFKARWIKRRRLVLSFSFSDGRISEFEYEKKMRTLRGDANLAWKYLPKELRANTEKEFFG